MRKIKLIIEALKRHNNFLITSHINMEGDAVGCQIAMARLLRKLGKRYIILDHDQAPKQFQFILGGEIINTDLRGAHRIDAVIALDCPVIERTGKVAPYFKTAKAVINIDHHISNAKFGDAIWIEPEMSSCGEMIYHLYKEAGIEIDKEAALAMYVAILTDTGSFAYENTGYRTHEIISELLKDSGIKPLWVANQLNEKKSINDLRLLKKTLDTLQLHANGRIATLYTSAAMLKKLNLKPSSSEGFVNYGRSLDGVKVAIFFLELPRKPGEVHVSFRSKGEVDVNKLAALFKGGGHPNASGCLIKGTISQAKKVVLDKIRLRIKRLGLC